jgi:hypothetical protein
MRCPTCRECGQFQAKLQGMEGGAACTHSLFWLAAGMGEEEPL